MAEEAARPAGFRESILKEVFGDLGFEEAVGLVGVLCQYRILFSRTFKTLLQDQKVNVDLVPLEPQAAANLVADLFGLDCDKLFLEYWARWHRLKDAPNTKELIAGIQSHRYVDRLEPWALL
jgi:hypothetical protein